MAGPYSVSVDSTSNPSYKIHRPATLSTTYKHPILTWANGTGGTCGGSATQLNHLASWGYVVVCWENGQTGTGDGVLQAAQWMVAQNTTSGSPYNNKLDIAKVGAFGHSQGATGAIEATIKSNGLIKSTVPLSFVDAWWHGGPLPDWTRVNKPILFIAGSADGLCTQTSTWYNNIPAGVPAGKGIRIGANHSTTIPDAGGSVLAYVTAWFRYTLENDTQARTAFVTVSGVAAEITRNSSNWQDTAFKSMP